MASSEAPASVLDASALLAHLNEEQGAAVVREAMQVGAAISVINWTEVLTKLAERGEDPELAAAELRAAGLIGATVNIEPVTDADCIAVARLRAATKAKGLSLAGSGLPGLGRPPQRPNDDGGPGLGGSRRSRTGSADPMSRGFLWRHQVVATG